jgi:hypothetical protein
LFRTAGGKTNRFGSSYEVFGFMNFNGGSTTDLMINGKVVTVAGIKKSQNSVQSHAHRFNAFGLQGQIAGPSRVWLILDADEKYSDHPDVHQNYPDKIEKYLYSFELSQDENRTTP